MNERNAVPLKSFCRIIITMTALIWSTSGCMSLPAKSIYDHVARSTVEVLIDGRLETTGWIASPDGYIITASHAFLNESKSIEARGAQIGRVKISVVAIDAGHDIILLKASAGKKPYEYLEVAQKRPAPGKDVYFYGSALFIHDILIQGQVAGAGNTYCYHGNINMPVEIFHIGAPTPPGASGGPWMDEYGRVIGNQSGYMKETGAELAMVVPHTAIRSLLASRKNANTASLGCGLEEFWTQPTGFIKRFPPGTEGLITIPIEKNGPAAKAGLDKESLITSIDGRIVSKRNDLLELVRQKKPGDTITLGVMAPDRTDVRKVTVELSSLEKQLFPWICGKL
jgi:S1-C subfamily serine protease